MKKASIILFLICFVCINHSFGQQSDSTLIIGKPAFFLVTDPGIKMELANAIKGFLKARNDQTNPNPYVSADYLKETIEPFIWLRGAESKMPDGKNIFTPTLLAIVPIGNQRYVIKLAYMAIGNKNQIMPELKLIASFELRKMNEGYFFYNAMDYNTKHWNVKQVGNIKYIYPNKLDEEQANKMDNFNTSFAKKFNTQPLKITYYKCDDPEQLFKMLGFDYIENMYYSLSGGLAYPWTNTLLAGNNSALYEHEAVHFYTSILFKNTSKAINEGYATYIGGSGGISISELAIFAKNYLNKNKNLAITLLPTDFKIRVEHGVPLAYILNALACKDVEEKQGIEGIKKLFSPEVEDDYFATLKRVNGIGENEFSNYMLSLLTDY